MLTGANYVVRERALDRRYLADPDACDHAWCVIQRHAQRYTRDEAKRRAKDLDAVVVRLVKE